MKRNLNVDFTVDFFQERYDKIKEFIKIKILEN